MSKIQHLTLLVIGLTISTLVLGACVGTIPAAPANTTPAQSAEAEAPAEAEAAEAEAPAEAEVAAPSGSIVIAQGTDAASLDPQRQNDAFTNSILSNIFDTLVYRTSGLELEPGLATEWTSVDDTTWELKLREGIKFHNGEEFTAEDVKFSLERPLDEELGSPLAGRFAVIEGVDIVDDYTVRVKTNDPYPLLPARLSEWFMLPKDYVEATDAETVVVSPVGTGAYKFVEWVKDDHLSLTANEDYWRGAPSINEVTFRPIPETSTRVAALQAGDVNIITNVPAFRQTELEGLDNLQAMPVRSTYIQYVALDGTKNPALADTKVRQALQYATDVPTLINSLFEGSAEQVSIPLAHGTVGYDESVEPYPYDVEKAQALLAEVGYPDGFTFELDAPVGRYAQDKEVVEALIGQWAKAGIEVKLNQNEWSVQLNKYRADELADAHFMGWGTSTFDADDILFNAFAKQPNKNNYTNDEVIDLVSRARSSMDPAEREQLYSQALDIIHEEVPWLFLFQQYDIYGVDTNIEWQPRPDQKIEVSTMTLN